MSAQRYEKAYLWVFISAIILCWSPSNLLAYLAPLISVAIFVFLTKSQVVIRNVIIWFLAWGVIISIYTVLKPEFLIHSALLSVLTYSSFVVVLAIPGRFVASLNLLDRMLTWARWIVIIQALLGITQGLYGFSKNLSFDGANGDFVEGTIHPALAAEYSFSNSMFAINIAFLLIALLPDLILRRKGYVAIILGGIALIMASVVHVLFMLAIAGTLAVIFFWPISLRRRMTYLVGVSLIILAMIASFALEKNFSTASGFARQLLSGESYRSIAIRRAVVEMPEDYKFLPLIGLGPGQFSSRAGLIGTGMYFGSTRNPRILPLMPTGRTRAFNYYTLDLWLQIEALEASGFSVGSTHKPWLSWLSVYTEWGILALIAILCFVFYLLLRVKVVSYSYPQRILASSFGTGLLLVLLLGLQENYWEVPQAILVGLLILKVQYAVLLNPETRNELI
jgi:hypothetical protein